MTLQRVLAFLTLAGCVAAQAGMYQQCGGVGWTGATTCVSGAYCSKLSDYYSQCSPGAASTIASTASSAPASPSSTASSPGASASAYTILAGGYSSAIASYRFTPSPPSLTLLSQSPTGQNPSWIALHPTNKSILYATNENTSGDAQAFTIGASGALSGAVATVASGGADPAYLLPLSSGGIAIMNYSGGNGAVLGAPMANPLQVTPGATITFAGNPSHPHMAYEYGSEILVPDLGADTVWRLGKDSSGAWAVHGSIPQPTGSGPRHIAVYDNHLFVLHELSSTLSVQPLPAAPNGTSTATSTLSITPTDGPAGAVWAAAELLLPPPSAAFPTPYVYVSNRNTATADARGDSIAIFAYDGAQGALALVAQVYTGLSQIRGMMLSGGAAEWLVAGAAAGTGGVGVWARTDGGKALELVVRNTEVATRTSFVWV